jgi:hypothetical protein
LPDTEAGFQTGRARQSRDFPPCDRGDRLGGFALRLARQPPAPQRDRHDAGGFRRQLQPPAGGEIELRHLAHYGTEAFRLQPLLHRPEHLVVAPDRDQDQARRLDALLLQAMGMEIDGGGIGRSDDPEDRRPGRQARQPKPGESGGDRRLFPVHPHPGDLMQRIAGKTG